MMKLKMRFTRRLFYCNTNVIAGNYLAPLYNFMGWESYASLLMDYRFQIISFPSFGVFCKFKVDHLWSIAVIFASNWLFQLIRKLVNCFILSKLYNLHQTVIKFRRKQYIVKLNCFLMRHRHTNWKFFWPQSMAPWTTGLMKKYFLSKSDFFTLYAIKYMF